MAETVEQLEAALAAARSVSEEIEARNALIWVLRAEDLCRAVTLSEGTVAMARAAGEAALLAPSLCMAGVCAGLASHPQAAFDLLRESLTLSCQCGDQVTEAVCYHYIGRVHWCLAEYAAAVESIQAAIALRVLQEDQEGLGDSYNLLGNISLNLCDYSSALDWHSQALQMREQCRDDYGVVESLNNIGAVYMEMEDNAQALLFHQRGLAHVQRLGIQDLELFILCNLGGDFLGLNRPEEALEVSGESGLCRRSAGTMEYMRDSDDQQRQCFRAAWKICSSSGSAQKFPGDGPLCAESGPCRRGSLSFGTRFSSGR